MKSKAKRQEPAGVLPEQSVVQAGTDGAGPENPARSDRPLDLAIQIITEWYDEATTNYAAAGIGTELEAGDAGERNAYWQVLRLLGDIKAKSSNQTQ